LVESLTPTGGFDKSWAIALSIAAGACFVV